MQFKIIPIPIFILSYLIQANPTTFQQDFKVFKESLMYVDDSIVKKEVAFFSIVGRYTLKPKPYAKSQVNEIKVSNFTDSSSTFSTKEFTIYLSSTKFDTAGHRIMQDSTDWPLLEIDSVLSFGTFTNIPKSKIKSVEYIFNNQRISLPERAIAGVYEPNFAFYNNKGERLKSLTEYPQTALCKVFQSLDKKRIYIHMQNSDAMSAYEITWVIQNNKYLRRIIDPL
jgi:hypothetical protein